MPLPHRQIRRPWLPLAALLIAVVAGGATGSGQSDRALVPAPIRDALLDELAGESALRHVEFLAANRDRQPDEYLDTFFETRYISDRLREYGLEPVVEYFPAGEIWDAEEGDLWMVTPTRQRLASLAMVPAALAAGSANAEVEAEVVYVGAGRDVDFEGKDVAGKIVLGNATTTAIFNAAVNQRGAAGALGTGSAGVSANTPGYTLDQIGWQSVAPRPGAGGFGFVLSLRQFNELRNLIERGDTVTLRARVRSRMYPHRLNVTSTTIKGSDPAAGELLFVAHAFERHHTPGANDNASGVATTLEIARTLARLVREGALPQPRRSIRFLWVPEIIGSREWMYAHPGIQDSLLAVLNYDMVGPDLEKTDTYVRMKMSPDSTPSYLDALIADLLRFIDQTDIRTQEGNNAPFNYRLVPYIPNSDHAIFLDAGIAAMQFNHWADNFYHSSADKAGMADPTQMKRMAFAGAAAFTYLANAGAAEAQALAWESAAMGEQWLAEVARQSARLLDTGAATLHERHRSAQNKVTWAFHRGRGSVESVLDLSKDAAVAATVARLVTELASARDAQARKLEALYHDRAAALGVSPTTIAPTAAEREHAALVPRKRFKFYSDEYRTRAPEVTKHLPEGPRLTGLAVPETSNFIDGERSILDIWNAVRAQYGHVTTNSTEHKFAYVVTPDTPDIPLEAVAGHIRAMEKAGLVEIVAR
jgi:aminopeptidase YwaD